ncbi:MAG: ATP-binding protein [Methanomassiliicoccales archaeon]
MIERANLDEKINSLQDWILRAGRSLESFYNPENGTFWRTIRQLNEKDSKLHPTSTNCSFIALHQYLRFLYEADLLDDEKLPGEIDNITSVLKGVCENYLSRLGSETEIVRLSETNGVNMFTDSQILFSVSILGNLKEVTALDVDLDRIREVALEIAKENRILLEEWNGGKASPKDEVHHLVTLHLIRALDMLHSASSDWTFEANPILIEKIKEDFLRLLAYEYAGVTSKYDPAELMFCIALLNRFEVSDADLLTARAIQSIVDSQLHDGAWPTSNISYEGNVMFHVSSYEVALSLTHLLIRRIHQGDLNSCEVILPALDQAFNLAKSNFNKVGSISGWSNDRTRKTGLIESWATATALMFLISYSDALLQLRQHLLLKDYSLSYPKPTPNLPIWPDMIPNIRKPDWIEMEELDYISDPTNGMALIGSLKEVMAKPISQSWIHQPSSMNSLIIHGPSGTRKTTTVKRMSEALKWPLITLSPSDFLSNGLEGFDAKAAKIFDDLTKMRRVIVLLDECEEFFKTRPQNAQLESRTAGAFITAGMLPRLQRLHDKRWIIIITITNSELSEIDPAVIRHGRFDYVVEIGLPTLNAQINYVKRKKLLENHKDNIIGALTLYDNKKSGGSEPKEVTFSHIDVLTIKLRGGQKSTPEGVFKLLEMEIARSNRPPDLIQFKE